MVENKKLSGFLPLYIVEGKLIKVKLSIVIPAFNASKSIKNALDSIASSLSENNCNNFEVIVVNDGSADVSNLLNICEAFKFVTVLHHDKNRGMCAARNTGINSSVGQYVTLLDADDEFVLDWLAVFLDIEKNWHPDANVCYSPCINDLDKLTCSNPGYTGWLTAESMVLEKFSGEYNPIFKGDYIRYRAYSDLGTRKSCGVLSYLRMAQEAPFWITDQVIRRYHDGTSQSVTYDWTRPDKALETYTCFSSVLSKHGDFIYKISPEKLQHLRLKILIYKMLSLQGRDYVECWKAKSFNRNWFATLFLLMLGPAFSAQLFIFAKRFSLIRRYG